MTHDKKRLLSIGEAAKALEVTRRMILNYEDKGLILPDQTKSLIRPSFPMVTNPLPSS